MSFAREQRDRGRPVLPMAAMVDILFLLLIYFLTASALREEERAIQVQLQQAGTGQAVSGVGEIVVTVTEDGGIYVHGNEYTLDGVRTLLESIAATTPNERIIVRGDKKSPLGTTQAILDIAYEQGLYQTMLGSAPPQQE